MKVEASNGSRLMRSLGRQNSVYAPENGLFQPFARVGEAIVKGQPAGRLFFHDTPMREPIELSFTADGIVSCRRFPTLTARGDCLFNLIVDAE